MTKKLVVNTSWGTTLGTLPENVGRRNDKLQWMPQRVSRNHLIVWVEDDKVKCQDARSTYGTWRQTDDDVVQTLSTSGGDASLSGLTSLGGAGDPSATLTVELFLREEQTEGEQIYLQPERGQLELAIGEYLILGAGKLDEDEGFPTHVRVYLVAGQETDTEKHVTLTVQACKLKAIPEEEEGLPPISDPEIPVQPSPNAGT